LLAGVVSIFEIVQNLQKNYTREL